MASNEFDQARDMFAAAALNGLLAGIFGSDPEGSGVGDMGPKACEKFAATAFLSGDAMLAEKLNRINLGRAFKWPDH